MTKQLSVIIRKTHMVAYKRRYLYYKVWDSISSRGGMKDGSMEKNVREKVHFYMLTF